MNVHVEPWQRRDDWASGWLESATGGWAPVAFLWIFALLWNTMSWIAMIATLRGSATGQTELAPVFPAVGLGILALAVYVTLQYRKWGRSRLELLTLPGVLGGTLRCVLHASPALARAEALEVSVDCAGPEPGEGKIRLMRHLWHHEVRVPGTRFELGEKIRVPLEFRLPYDLPESDPRRTGGDATWTLRVHANVPGVDYEAGFDLPVFRTPESSPAEEGSRVGASPLAPSLLGTPGSRAVPALSGSKIRVRPYGLGGREFVFGMLRNPWMGLLTLLFTFLFGGFVALILYAEGPGFFLVVFTLATLLLVYASLDTLFAITRVRAERGRIRVRHGPFGIGPTRSVDLHEIARIRVVPQVQYGTRTYCQIRIERRARRPGERAWGRVVTAGSRIPTQAEAETLAQAMGEAVGLTAPNQASIAWRASATRRASPSRS